MHIKKIYIHQISPINLQKMKFILIINIIHNTENII